MENKEYQAIIQPFDAKQKIIAPDNVSTYVETGLVIDYLLASCVAEQVNKVHLFSDNADYVSNLVDELKKQQQLNYAKLNLEIEVN